MNGSGVVISLLVDGAIVVGVVCSNGWIVVDDLAVGEDDALLHGKLLLTCFREEENAA